MATESGGFRVNDRKVRHRLDSRMRVKAAVSDAMALGAMLDYSRLPSLILEDCDVERQQEIQECEEAIEALKAHARMGVCSIVEYSKDSGSSVLRTVEPTRVLAGCDSVLLRAIQHDPARGVRIFATASLRVTGVSAVPRVRDGSEFLRQNVRAIWELVERPRRRDEARIYEYVSAVRRVLADLTLEGDEVERTEALRRRLGISLSEMRAAHAIVFSELIGAFALDLEFDAAEEEQVERAIRCLDDLGWAPQT